MICAIVCGMLWNLEDADDISRVFKAAKPVRHAIFDDFVTDGEIQASFPGESWKHWINLGDGYQRNKFICSDRESIPKPLGDLIDSLSGPRFLKRLEEISGISGLIPDPYLSGGGLHLSTGGGILAMHTDFHYYKRLGIYRRLNLLVYLHDNWQPSDGGQLEIESPQSKHTRVIDPLPGRAVLFETNDRSVHGFRRPVAEGKERRSLALYYYTADEAPDFSGDETTHWREHLGLERRRSLRFLVYRVLMKTSRVFSIVAHLVNPNQGLDLLRHRLRKRSGDRGSKQG